MWEEKKPTELDFEGTENDGLRGGTAVGMEKQHSISMNEAFGGD